MKSVIKIILGMLLFSGLAYAKPPYGMAGCGLGTYVVKSNGFSQVFAATTNDTAYTQIFGISSGTSNCIEPGKMAKIETQQQFVKDNFTTLSKEMAQGQGQTLTAFATTFGCEQNSISHFNSTMKNSYSDLFKSPGAMSFLSKVKDTMKSDQALKTSCKDLI